MFKMLYSGKRTLFLFILINIILIVKFFYNYDGIEKFATLILTINENISDEQIEKEEQIKDAFYKRDINNQLLHLYYTLNAEQYLNKTILEYHTINDQIIKLLSIARNLTNFDQQWHNDFLFRLGKHFQNVLNRLQNPENCSQTKLLICKVNYPNCGFGCILHHISYWLTIATASNRTLILENDGQNWAYGGGWEDILQPITKCKYKESIHPIVPPFPEYNDTKQSDRIVATILENDTFSYSPLVVPKKYANDLLIHNSDPAMWFMSQFINFLWKFNNSTMERIKNIEASLKIPFDKGSILCIHVRRTDKSKEPEGEYYALNDDMKWVELWYEIEFHRFEKDINANLQKRLFIATDDPALLIEARKQLGNQQYEIFALDQNAKLAEKIETRYTYESLYGLIAEINILARCNFVVCTFTSNVCRLIIELMESTRGNAAQNVHSLDLYYHEWFKPTQMTTIDDYSTTNPHEINATLNDQIEILRLFWNGTIKGLNKRTEKIGLFPSYLLKNSLRIADFPIFD